MSSCEKNSIPYSSNITTNGYFLTSDVVDSLLQHEVRSFQVTLDGPESTHNRTRKLAGGGGTYKRIINNLKGMREKDADFSVTIRVNFDPTSIPLMDEFFTEISAFFAHDSRFSLYFRPIGKWGGPNDSNLETCDAKSSALVKADLTEKQLSFGFSDNSVKRFLMAHGNVCYAAKESSIVVGADGTVYKCTVAFDDQRNHVGKITKDGRLIINQSRWDLWVKIDDEIDTSGCNSCPFIPSCQSKACPRTAMDSKRVHCPMTKTEYEAMVRSIAFGREISVQHPLSS
jgi:uncharacterized protein